MKKKKKKPKERNRRALGGASRISILIFVMVLLTSLGLPRLGWAADPPLQSDSFQLSLSFAGVAVAMIVLAILFNSFFVAAETAMDILRPMHTRHFEKDPAKQEALNRILKNKSTYVAASHLGSQIMRALLIGLCFVVAPSAAQFAASRGIRDFSEQSLWLAGLVLTLVVFTFNVVFAELVGRTYAGINPAATSLRLRRFIKLFAIVFKPFILLFTGLAGLITTRFGARASFVVQNMAEEEIKTIVESAQVSGEIEREEKELLHSVFEFSDTVAREVMTPRVDMNAVDASTEPSDVIELIQQSGHSRIPVYEGTDDQIIGIVHAKDLLLAQLRSSYSVTLRALMRPPLFVPENKNLHDLLREMRTARSQMAIVQDEFGGTAGLVTIEDIVEELVGEIVDEYDIEEPDIIPNGTGFIALGKVNLYDLNDEIGSAFQSEEFDTLGGYVFGLFGRQPKKDEQIESEGYRFRVYETDGRRIGKVHVERLPEVAAGMNEDDL